ncbi:hypothetical protein BUALT_Bualt10G0001500 [Buddleja alternifolia]|uniref:Uncharacterized protein n=1 Tax=Buddleja alternifolia TaxID=168488 RepID=A0AAV6X1E9_9LAMI|nr:hypothetical protein BUALT_Bualt10G0001500 [Buddleja alternifolia]
MGFFNFFPLLFNSTERRRFSPPLSKKNCPLPLLRTVVPGHASPADSHVLLRNTRYAPLFAAPADICPFSCHALLLFFVG